MGGEIKMTNEEMARLTERLATFYHSKYVAKNQPWVLEIPFDQWLRRQFMRIGGIV